MKLKIFVAVACFLPGRAKDLSVPLYILSRWPKIIRTLLLSRPVQDHLEDGKETLEEMSAVIRCPNFSQPDLHRILDFQSAVVVTTNFLLLDISKRIRPSSRSFVLLHKLYFCCDGLLAPGKYHSWSTTPFFAHCYLTKSQLSTISASSLHLSQPGGAPCHGATQYSLHVLSEISHRLENYFLSFSVIS